MKPKSIDIIALFNACVKEPDCYNRRMTRMSFNCHACDCADCLLARTCCKSCNGSPKPLGSCEDKQPVQVSPQIAAAAFKTLFDALDAREFAEVFMAVEGVR